MILREYIPVLIAKIYNVILQSLRLEYDQQQFKQCYHNLDKESSIGLSSLTL